MAGRVTRVELNRAEINRTVRSPAGPVYREVAKHTRRVTTLAKMKANVDTGKMRSEINGETSIKGKRIIGRISSPAKYSMWVHEGRGPVYPKKAQALRFKPKKGRPQGRGARGSKGGYVFAKRVGPYPGNPFLTDALKEGQPWPVTKGR
jgi:hypothetical protein